MLGPPNYCCLVSFMRASQKGNILVSYATLAKSVLPKYPSQDRSESPLRLSASCYSLLWSIGPRFEIVRLEGGEMCGLPRLSGNPHNGAKLASTAKWHGQLHYLSLDPP
jgi:hypothetical protein